VLLNLRLLQRHNLLKLALQQLKPHNLLKLKPLLQKLKLPL